MNEQTLSIHSIYTRRREAFYWATVMATFALGTAAGDLTARTLHFAIPLNSQSVIGSLSWILLLSELPNLK